MRLLVAPLEGQGLGAIFSRRRPIVENALDRLVGTQQRVRALLWRAGWLPRLPLVLKDRGRAASASPEGGLRVAARDLISVRKSSLKAADYASY